MTRFKRRMLIGTAEGMDDHLTAHAFKSSRLPDPDTRRGSLLGLDPRTVAKKGEGSHDTHCLYG